MLSGPGSIALTIGFSSLADHWLDYGAIILGICIVAVISYVTLRLSGQMVRVIGANGMNALTKLMGFLLLCIGVQFIVQRRNQHRHRSGITARHPRRPEAVTRRSRRLAASPPRWQEAPIPAATCAGLT